MRTPSSALPACPHGRVLGLGSPPTARRAPLAFLADLSGAALAVVLSATTFLAAARAPPLRVAARLRPAALAAVLVFFAFLRVAIVVPSVCLSRRARLL